MLDIQVILRAPHAPAVDRVIDAAMYDAGRDLEVAIEDAWPVDTGTSRQGYVLLGTGADWELRNLTAYAGYVHRRGSSATLASTLIPELSQQVADAAAIRLARELPASILSEVM